MSRRVYEPSDVVERAANCEGASGTCGARPLGKGHQRDAVGHPEVWDVGVVADAFEPFGHDCEVLAVLPDLLDRLLNDANGPSEGLAQNRGSILHADGVPRDVDRRAAERLGLREGVSGEASDIVDGA